jgi:hypothetical protein
MKSTGITSPVCACLTRSGSARMSLAVAGAVLVLSGCSASASTGSGSAGAGAAVSTASAVSTGSAGAGSGSVSGAGPGNTLSGMSATQIAAKANADLKKATSFRVVGSITTSGIAEKLNITSSRGDCSGTVTINGTAVGFVVIGPAMWVKVSGLPGYQKTSAGNSSYGGLAILCGPSQLAAAIDIPFGLTADGSAVVGGQHALRLAASGAATIYVTDSAATEYVRVDIAGQEQLDFSEIDKPLTITAPPSSHVLP